VKIKKLALTIVSLVLLVTTALCALTTYGTYSWFQRNPLEIDISDSQLVSGQAIEHLELPAHRIIKVYTQAGDIAVEVADVDKISLEITRVAWARSATEAQATAAGLQLDIQQDGETLNLSYRPRVRKVRILGMAKMDKINLTLRIPAQTVISLQSGNGEIHLINQ
jgi:hypothetical protein